MNIDFRMYLRTERQSNLNINQPIQDIILTIRQNQKNYIWLHLIVCLFRGFRPTREFFTHMETSSLSVKGCKVWPLLCTHGH